MAQSGKNSGNKHAGKNNSHGSEGGSKKNVSFLGGGDSSTNAVEMIAPLLRNSLINSNNPGAVRQLRQLEMKQKVMEASMRRLLSSMRDLRTRERDVGYSMELDKRRRVKLTRMIQILMLQRRNMQLQNDTLRKEVITLTRKFMGLRKRAERLVVENINMRKFYSEARSDGDRKALQIETLLQNKVLLQKHVQDRVDLKVEVENLKFEIKRLLAENHNLKQSLRNTENMLEVKVKEKEEAELENSQLRANMTKLETEETNLRLRYERLLFENESLRKNEQKNRSNKGNYDTVVFEYEKLREKMDEMQRGYHRLERMYDNESNQRKELHNQLQEARGNIRVICRVRPSSSSSEDFKWEFNSTDKILVSAKYAEKYRGSETGVFSLNRVIRTGSKQEEVFEEVRPLLCSCMDGYNVCILAYGPTGSGKTHTMQGTRDAPGITLRAIAELSDLCEAVRGVWKIDVKVAMFEVYNEVIYDLLNEHAQSVRICDDGTELRLMDVVEKLANTEQELLFWIAKGHKRRKEAATKMNLNSSRSHLIIRIQVVMTSTLNINQRSSTLLFCDLAGSESADRLIDDSGQQIETGYINKSLVTLKRVFEALREQAIVVPYRESKLTHILKPCLGGSAKCMLIITVTSDKTRIERSINALRFGQSAMQIGLGKIKQNVKILSGKQTRHRGRGAKKGWNTETKVMHCES